MSPTGAAPPPRVPQAAPHWRGRVVEGLALTALGAVQTLAHVHTWAWALPMLTLAVLVWRLDMASGVSTLSSTDGAGRAVPGGRGTGAAAWLAWCYGTGWLVAGVWWLFISMHRYGELPAWMAALAVLALAAGLSLYLAAAGAAYARWRRGRMPTDALLFSGLWLLAELARGVIFTGFPWVASGYSQVDGPLAAWAPWVGVYGIGFGVALIAALLAALLPGRGPRRSVRWGAVAGVVVLLLPGVFGPVSFSTAAGRLEVRLLQTQVAQDEKFVAERLPETLAWVAAALMGLDTVASTDANASIDTGTGERPGDDGLRFPPSDDPMQQPAAAQTPAGTTGAPVLSIAPETAVPLLPEQLEDFAPGYWAMLVEHFQAPGLAALIGVPLGDPVTGYTNSVVGLAAGVQYRYDKWHLVPFGEFIPTGFRWFTEMMNIPLGDFARGVRRPQSFEFAGQRIAPNICYEDLFGEELALRFVDGTSAPTLLANVSNIAWFGRTIAITQHLNISRMRTLELQRPMVRSTNTGATAVIDHRGRVGAMLPPEARGVLSATVEGRDGLTPFVRWAGRWGLWPALALALLACVPALLGRRAARG
jgi:apolipoprotein N-acyltransferase